jgi:hypothetical protein
MQNTFIQKAARKMLVKLSPRQRIVKNGKQTKFDKFGGAEAFEEEDPEVHRTRQPAEVAQYRGRKEQGQVGLDEAERPQAKA